MVDASGLIEALKRDSLDQRAVADHLMLLAKVRIRDYGHVALLRRFVGCCICPTLTSYVIFIYSFEPLFLLDTCCRVQLPLPLTPTADRFYSVTCARTSHGMMVDKGTEKQHCLSGECRAFSLPHAGSFRPNIDRGSTAA